MACIWKLGGLNSGFAKASLQEYSSLGVEVSEVADEGEQGPKYYVITIFSTLGSSLWSVRVFLVFSGMYV